MSNEMHAYLVVGANKNDREIEIERLLTDNGVLPISIIAPGSLGIEGIREIKRLAQLGSMTKRAILVNNAHQMTIEAQNAFLKTLEEPPGNTIVILSAQNEGALLPTIRSRCTTINITATQTSPPEFLEEQEELFKKLTNAGVGERIKFAEDTGKTREEAVAFIENQLSLIHNLLQNEPSFARDSLAIVTKALLAALQNLRSNANPKMALFEAIKNY